MAAFAMFAVFALASCEKKTPEEKAAEDMKEAAESVGDAVKEIGESIEDAAKE